MSDGQAPAAKPADEGTSPIPEGVDVGVNAGKKTPNPMKEERRSPGKFEELSQEVQSVVGGLEVFEGLNVEYVKQLSQSFGVGHTFRMSQAPREEAPAPYECFATYSSAKMMLRASIEPSTKQVSTRFVYAPDQRWLAKFSASAGESPSELAGSAELDYAGKDFTSQLKYISSHDIFIGNYMQSLTSKVAAGANLTHVRNASTIVNGLVKYSTRNGFALLTVGPHGMLGASYMHDVGGKMKFAADLQLSRRNFNSVASVGAAFTFRQGTIKTSMDTQWRLSTYIESALNPLMMMTLSAQADMKRKALTLGAGIRMALSPVPEGMEIGPNGEFVPAGSNPAPM